MSRGHVSARLGGQRTSKPVRVERITAGAGHHPTTMDVDHCRKRARGRGWRELDVELDVDVSDTRVSNGLHRLEVTTTQCPAPSYICVKREC